MDTNAVLTNGHAMSARPAKRRRSRLPDGDVPASRVDMPEAAPWCIVYTLRGRRFFHNRDTSASAWHCPVEIEASYAAFIQRSRDELLNADEASDAHEDESDYEGASENDSAVDDIVSDDTAMDDSGDNIQDSDDSDEEDAEATAHSADTQVADEDAEADLAEQLEALAEEHADVNTHPYADIPSDERRKIFTQMLHDFDVHPFRPWDQEVDKLVQDNRYLALDTTRDRKAVFQQYCADKIAAQKASVSQNASVDPQAAFLALVAQSSKCQFFADFKRKHRHDDAYKRFGSSDHDRERLFRAFRTAAKQSLPDRQAAFRKLLRASGKTEQVESDVAYHALSAQQRDAILAEQT